jgi:hypothetical protein
MATGIKTGGRQKGVLNRTTSETKEVLKKIVNKELNGINSLLEKLEPKERIDALIKLLPYIVPKQNEIAVENKERFSTITVNIVPPIDYDDDDDESEIH